ncbi:chloride channel protein [Sciscionella marina]|uniref:chloride channel protein n=1 Tax=Sciscionella marina TaxID=508770 RepID=UPI00037D7B10|nr:chloride channel protein [Sciscionella marina]
MSEAAGRRWSLAVPGRVPLRAWIAERTGGLVVLAVLIGAGAGIGAVGFRWLISAVTRVLSGHADYSDAGHAANGLVPWLGPYFVLFAPVVAGLIYGPLVNKFAPEARGHGVPEVMYAVAERGGRIAPQVTVVKALASALCIGGGGSVGREGPIVQIGSAWGSTIGRLTRIPEARLRVLVACGAAGGIAATFNAPLAGPFFAMELILRDFAARAFGAVVLSSVTASVIGRAMLGDHPFLDLPKLHIHHAYQYLLFALLGLVVGMVGVAFSRLLYLIEDACDWLWRGPEWLRPAIGGLLLGGLLLVLPQMYGVGYPVMQHAMDGRFGLWLLLALATGKILATGLTIGIGGSGGVFAPSLFIGAMSGTAFGILADQLVPGAGSPGLYGLIGMGAAFAGATRAAITGIIVLFELTGEYSIILPLMLAIVLATVVSRRLSGDTIYTFKLTRRGVRLDHPRRFGGRAVGTVMEPLPEPLPAQTPLEEAARELLLSANGAAPVIGEDEQYHGCVTARAVAEALDQEAQRSCLADLAQHPPTVTADASLDAALDALVEVDASGIPVLDEKAHELVGWITHRTVLAALPETAVATGGR